MFGNRFKNILLKRGRHHRQTYGRVKEVEGVSRQTCYDMGPRLTSEGPPLYLSIEKY